MPFDSVADDANKSVPESSPVISVRVWKSPLAIAVLKPGIRGGKSDLLLQQLP